MREFLLLVRLVGFLYLCMRITVDANSLVLGGVVACLCYRVELHAIEIFFLKRRNNIQDGVTPD